MIATKFFGSTLDGKKKSSNFFEKCVFKSIDVSVFISIFGLLFIEYV